MSDIFREDPFPHFVFNNVFDPQELDQILRELAGIHQANLFFAPAAEDTSVSPGGKIRNTSRNIWLDDIYKRNRSNSTAIAATEDFLRVKLLKDIQQSKNWYFCNTIEMANFHGTLLNYYADESQYESHRDYSYFSLICTFYQEPRVFKGGNVYFPQHDLEIETLNNSVIVFPGCVVHEITPVKISEEDAAEGLSRFGLVLFLGRKD